MDRKGRRVGSTGLVIGILGGIYIFVTNGFSAFLYVALFGLVALKSVFFLTERPKLFTVSWFLLSFHALLTGLSSYLSQHPFILILGLGVLAIICLYRGIQAYRLLGAPDS